MSTLMVPIATLPATAPELLAKIAELEKFQLAQELEHFAEQVPTDHLIHAGMYVRTILMPKDSVLTGVLMKVPTVVIVTGSAAVLAGDEWVELEGYNVIPASAGRKQVYVSRGPVLITMLFPTTARTVEAAEAEFTDQADALLSHRQNANRVVITEE